VLPPSAAAAASPHVSESDLRSCRYVEVQAGRVSGPQVSGSRAPAHIHHGGGNTRRDRPQQKSQAVASIQKLVRACVFFIATGQAVKAVEGR